TLFSIRTYTRRKKILGVCSSIPIYFLKATRGPLKYLNNYKNISFVSTLDWRVLYSEFISTNKS
ncbi:MAG: hypothetical protein KDD60_04715, partial [Bdellovibrionales bacterium]|nr:hypothetical protein [Bdellovibrionales bacterium]